MVHRFDFGRLAKARRLAAGGVVVPATVTRTGVFEYRRADGTVSRELRTDAEVFSQASLDTLRGAPVTNLHPKKMVDTSNWKDVSVGVVLSEASKKDNLVGVDLLVNEQVTIDQIESSTRQETSCGYSCDLLNEPGEHEGERYDSIQTNIRYNHVALGPPNWARAGREARLRLDSSAAVAVIDEPSPKQEPEHKETATMKFTIDGIEYDTEKDPSAASQAFTQFNAEHDSLKKDHADTSANLQKVEGERDALKSEVKELKEKFDSMPQLIQEGIDLRSAAAKIDPSLKTDGLSDREIRVAAIKSVRKDFDDTDRSDDYVVGVFEHVSVQQPKNDAKEAHKKVRTVAKKDGRKSDSPAKPIPQPWEAPLAVSKSN